MITNPHFVVDVTQNTGHLVLWPTPVLSLDTLHNNLVGIYGREWEEP
jgi:hypothetical protein